MSLQNDEIATLLNTHADALFGLYMNNVELMITKLKGIEDPQSDYAKGYRDAIDTMLIQLHNMRQVYEFQRKADN